MLYKAKVAACSDIRTKHSTQSERHVEFFNVNPLATEFSFKFWHILYLKREYYRNQKR